MWDIYYQLETTETSDENPAVAALFLVLLFSSSHDEHIKSKHKGMGIGFALAELSLLYRQNAEIRCTLCSFDVQA